MVTMHLHSSLVIIVWVMWSEVAGKPDGNSGMERPESPERKINLPKVPSIQKSTDRWYSIYGPPPQISPRCDFLTLMSNDAHDAHGACTDECRNIAHVVDAALEHYPDSYPIMKLHRQCSRFYDGHCRQVFWSQTTWCDCLGKDFSRPARFCRIMIGGTRIVANSGLILGDYLKWLVDYATERGYLSKQDSAEVPKKDGQITMMSIEKPPQFPTSKL